MAAAAGSAPAADCTISWNGAIRWAVWVEKVGVQHEPLGEIGLVADGQHLGPLVEDDVLVVAADRDVPGLVQQRRLVAEGGVDRLDRHAGGAGDVGHGGAAVALLDEQVAGRPHDRRPGLLRLCLAAGRVV